MFFLRLLFRDEGHLYVNCLFYIQTIYPKYLLFQLLSGGIHMDISIITGVQNGRTSLWKSSHILLKTFFFRLYFRNEGHLYANCLFYILPIYYNCLLSQFLSGRIRMHIPILRGVQNERTSLGRNSRISL